MGDLTDSIWFERRPATRSPDRLRHKPSDTTRPDTVMTFTRLVPLLSSVECQVRRSVKPHSVIGNCRSAWGHGAKVKGRVWPYGIVHPQSPKAHSAPIPTLALVASDENDDTC